MKDKTTRRVPCRRTNEIEPRIRPLVSALNATRLVTTFSSCEGHFGRPPTDATSACERDTGERQEAGAGRASRARSRGHAAASRPGDCQARRRRAWGKAKPPRRSLILACVGLYLSLPTPT